MKIAGEIFMANARFNAWGKSPRTPRRVQMALFIPLICFLLIGTFFVYHFSPFGHNRGAEASTMVILPGHVPGLEKNSALLGPTDPHTTIQVLVGFRLRNQQMLKDYVDSMSRPHSVTAHRYLTPAQIAQAFAPSQASQSAIIAYLQQAGFTLTQTYKHQLALGFTATIGQAESAFNIQINNYRAPGGRVFYAPGSDPGVPASIAPFIQSIIGLDNARQYTHPPLLSNQHVTASVAHPNGVNCLAAQPGPVYSYYLPSQIATAYNLTSFYNQGLSGQGQTVALLELDDFNASDITAYTSCYGGASVPITRILINGGTGHPAGSAALEVELDMELVLSAAPKLASLRVYEAADTTVGYLADWSQIVSDATPIVSTSWGSCESSAFAQAVYTQENTLFIAAAAQGQTLFAASGDSGSNDCQKLPPTTPSVDDPASQPYITGVGGTSLTIAANGTYGSEKAWNANGNASGGGQSTLWAMPTWQQISTTNIVGFSSNVPCGAAVGSFCREVPDVSFNADPAVGYPVYCTVTASGCNASTLWAIVGGTSAASPMWAAMTALVNQKALYNGAFNLGFLNPLLYSIDKNSGGTHYATDFHDVTTGNNYLTGDGNNEYPAGTDYDMVTGLGSPSAASLASDLSLLSTAQLGSRNSPANTTWYFAEGSVGGSFNEYITLLNPDPVHTATVNITYLFQNKPAAVRQHLVSPSTRFTVSANADLGISSSAAQVAISAIVQSVGTISNPTAVPIIAERPMYFNFHGIKSGTDVMGATNATNTLFYFAEGDTRQSSPATNSTFITILNPSQTTSAQVTITYYSNGAAVETDVLNVGPLQRGTGIPRLHQQFSVKVTSTIGIVVERPMYSYDNVSTGGGWTSGAASAVGATSLGTNAGSDWLFAEGYTGTHNDFQEYLVLANFTGTNVIADVKLEYTNGTVQTVPVTVNALGQYYFDVNNAFKNPIAGCTCTPTPSVSAEVYTSTPSIVAERLMYFHYGPQFISGITDVVGEAGPSSHAVYSFAEGYTLGSFNEYLTLQNPNNSAETVAITLFADSTIEQHMLQLLPHSRTTVYINSFIVPLATAYPSNPIYNAYEVSMDIQILSLNGGPVGTVVAERPMYFNYFGDPGGTDVLGYTGG
jgi:Pro-kumamolisin, activation domain